MIVTVEELVDYMSNVSLSADQRQAAEVVLEGVQAEVETYLNRSCEPGEYIETLAPDADGYLWPSQTPVTEIVSVNQLPPSPLPVGYVPVAVWHDFAEGQIYVGPGTSLELRYKAGLPSHAYRFLKLEVLRITAREMENRHDDTLGVTDLTARAPTPRPVALQDDDRVRLNRWRRRVVV